MDVSRFLSSYSIEKVIRRRLFVHTKLMPYFFFGLAAGFLAGAIVAMASSYMIVLES